MRASSSQWCERGGCPDPSALDHRALRRYLAYLQTRGFSRCVDRAQGRVGPRVPAPSPPARRPRPRRRGRGPGAEGRAASARACPGASEAAALLDDLDRSRPTPTIPGRLRDLAIVELLYGAGLRVSECCGLDVGDVDLRRSTVTALGKGAKVRRLPLGEPARDAVAAYLASGRPRWPARTNPAPRPRTRCSSTPGAGA